MIKAPRWGAFIVFRGLLRAKYYKNIEKYQNA